MSQSLSSKAFAASAAASKKIALAKKYERQASQAGSRSLRARLSRKANKYYRQAYQLLQSVG